MKNQFVASHHAAGNKKRFLGQETRAKIRHLPAILKATYKSWMEQDPFRQSAVIAYYAIFSLPALLVIVIAVASFIFEKDVVTGRLSSEISKLMGTSTAKQIEDMIANASIGNKSVIATILAVITILIGATGVFVQLQKSLNMIWEVKPVAGKKAFLKLLQTRLLSFGMILSIGFLLIISLVVTSVISILGDWLTLQLPQLAVFIMQAINFIISFGIITILFAVIYKYLPDAKIRWKDVWSGAIMTSVLFSIGKLALGLYFAKADPTSAYGAAGSIVLIMLWISYSGMIFFFGAEFTRQYTSWGGKEITPAESAEKDPLARVKINK